MSTNVDIQPASVIDEEIAMSNLSIYNSRVCFDFEIMNEKAGPLPVPEINYQTYTLRWMIIISLKI